MKKYICTICGFIYDEAKGIPESGITPGVKWGDLPEDWKCPLCGASKADFKEQIQEHETEHESVTENHNPLRELSIAELSALCSNLAKGCEKQYLSQEAELFIQLAEYYKGKTPDVPDHSFQDLMDHIQKELDYLIPQANVIAADKEDRGAKRALTWSEKVTRMVNSLLSRYEAEGNAMLENTRVYICDICGFIYIGDEPPEICPVCKVPKLKIIEIRR